MTEIYTSKSPRKGLSKGSFKRRGTNTSSMKAKEYSKLYHRHGSMENNVYKNRLGNCTCATRRRALSFDVLGNELGCITGYRNKISTRIISLRGNDHSPSSRPNSTCPIHGGNFDDDANLKYRSTMGEQTKFSYKDVIMIWHDAVEYVRKEQWKDAFNTLQEIKNYSAVMQFNMGQISWALQKPDLAKENFMAAIEKDPHMALAHFQLGMVNYRLHRYNESRRSYDKAKTCLRGNKFIDYRQLGFVHKLYECEVQYNLALTYATMMNNSEYALELLEEASKVATEARHGTMIDRAQSQLLRNKLYEPFVLPGNQLFRPPKSKVDNLKTVDYLGKAKVVSELPEQRNNNNKEDFQFPTKAGDKNTFRPIADDFSDDEIDGFSSTLNANSTSPNMSIVARMTHKDTLATWHEGVQAFEKGDISEALYQLNGVIDPSAKILYNIGILQMSLGQLEDALSAFREVVSSDPYLAIGHFQLGIVQGKLRHCDDAWHSFEKTLEVLRGNKLIDYKQLGLQYKLHKCEVLHNEAWTYNEQNERDWALKLLEEAIGSKADARHDKMDESLRNFKNGYSFELFEPPKALLFKPPKSKIDNLERKDYLGKAKVVAKLPSQRGGASTPPPPSSSSLGVPVQEPRSKTPTPASSGQKAPPSSKPPPGNRNISAPPLPARPISQEPQGSPAVTVALTTPGPPRRPPPAKSPVMISPDLPLPPRVNDTPSPPPSRPLPARISPVPSRLSSDGHNSPPNRPLPSPNRTSPIPPRPVPQRPPLQNGHAENGHKAYGENPPSRPLPSPNHSSPVPERPLPKKPSVAGDAPLLTAHSTTLPDRPLPPPPPMKTGSFELPDRPLPKPPSDEPELANRSFPVSTTSEVCELAKRPVPPRPSLKKDIAEKALPPPPVNERNVPPRSLPSPQLVSKTSLDIANRPVPVLSKQNEESYDEFPSRPIAPLPRTCASEDSDPASGKLPTRPNILGTISAAPLEDSPLRPAQAQPSPGNTEPELPTRPSSITPKLPDRVPVGQTNPRLPGRLERQRGAPLVADRPVLSPPLSLNNDSTSSSQSLPELPPPPPPKKGSSPVPPRKADAEKKAPGHRAKLVKIEADSPPVLRKAAAVTVVHQEQKEERPSIPSKPSVGKPTLPANKPTPAINKPKPATNKPLPITVKPSVAINKPSNQAFKLQSSASGGGEARGKRTALVIASHEASADGELSVLEGDLITITSEDGDWLEADVNGKSGRLPRSCVKNFSKPGININF